MEDRTHYIYRHLRLDTKEPFYIGLGTKPKRCVTHEMEYKRAFNLNARSGHWQKIYACHGVIVEIIFECNDYEYAQKKETEFIALYGREDNGSGCLVNRTDGGKGTIGRIFKHSEESKKKFSELKRGGKITKEHAIKLHEGRKNWITTDAQRERYSLSKKGIKHTEAHRLKNSASKSMGNHPRAKKVIDNETGAIYSCAKEAAIIHGLNYLKMIRILNDLTKKSNNYEAIKKFSFV